MSFETPINQDPLQGLPWEEAGRDFSTLHPSLTELDKGFVAEVPEGDVMDVGFANGPSVLGDDDPFDELRGDFPVNGVPEDGPEEDFGAGESLSAKLARRIGKTALDPILDSELDPALEKSIRTLDSAALDYSLSTIG